MDSLKSKSDLTEGRLGREFVVAPQGTWRGGRRMKADPGVEAGLPHPAARRLRREGVPGL